MFRKLRNRFLVLNLVIISVMMLVSFSIIYIITYKNVRAEIDNNLHRIADISHKPNNQPRMNPNETGANNNEVIPKTDDKMPSERSVAFTLITDSSWNIQSVNSIFIMEDAFYKSARDIAVGQNKATGRFKLDDTNWAYIMISTGDGNRIVFLDITQQQKILLNLTYTFLAVAFAMLICIYFISRFFANRSIRPVQEAFDKQKQFIADASHELKTPMSVINTNVDVLLSNGDDTINQQSKWLHYIKSECERMTKLTNDLLYLTQMDYSEIRTIYTDFNFSEAVENVILAMEAVFFEHSLTFNYTMEPDLLVHGNIEELKQVAMILLDNAIKYTNPNGTVDIVLKKRHNECILSVTNTGEGIAEEHLEKIFDRFYRTDKSRARKQGGYGLGLAIAKAITEQHSGKIYAKSILGKTTTFAVELPLISA